MATYMVSRVATPAELGYGNAVAVILFVISLVIALVYQRFVLRRDTAGATHRREEVMRMTVTMAPTAAPAPARPPPRGGAGRLPRTAR